LDSLTRFQIDSHIEIIVCRILPIFATFRWHLNCVTLLKLFQGLLWTGKEIDQSHLLQYFFMTSVYNILIKTMKLFLSFRTLFILLITGLIIFVEIVPAQSGNPTVYISNLTAPAIGQPVIVPVRLKNLQGVGSVSLKIIFDTSVLNFVSIDDSAGHGTFVTNSSIAALGGAHDTIAIAWFDLTPISYTDGVFAKLNFTYKGGSSSLHFLPSPISSLSDENGIAIPNLVFTDGSVTPESSSTVNSLSGRVFIDANENGIRDSDEVGLQWVSVDLFKSDGSYAGYRITDAQGNYKYDSLSSGSYYAMFTLVGDNDIYTFTVKGAGSNRSLDSDVRIVDPKKDTIAVSDTTALVPGANLGSWDAGVYPKYLVGVIGDYVWDDANKNGIQETGESPLPNVKVFLLDSTGTTKLDSATTDSNGNYLFSKLRIGDYRVKFITPAGYVLSRKKEAGTLSWAGDSDPDSLTGVTDTIQIVSGFLNRYDVDAGMHTPSGEMAVNGQSTLPKDFTLSQNYPNPFNPSTVIQFTVPRQEHIYLIVYNITGQKVATLVDEELTVGTHEVTFNANNFASGIYFYRLIGNSVNITKKMMLLK
jgi:SdrD B-like domain/Cohesin domain/Secretion system C-terminal sorting domain